MLDVFALWFFDKDERPCWGSNAFEPPEHAKADL
jgi:hypothetical protein